eukprot:CAMPEP_0198262484 /NCGR_PEP_ID=MMETSP1447-20131203/10986_1 /TAXON_ID=420782 /ORGANISM="Chaetoceros dichaeta, Strain CCMP1751" /LENGTH=232 /DNA_ID=CAMNT_0043950743 /DNA_START=64 /DNA_END=762 /DNA_ORIENTATION=+
MRATTIISIGASIGSASAFAPNRNTYAISTSQLSAEKKDDDNMSEALPFVERPKMLDGSLPGDVGFDPFGLAGDDKASLVYKREAEIKHGRLAMLAVVGWPLAELWDKQIAAALGLQDSLTSSGASPSPLNGGLDKIEPEYWLIVACTAGIFELQSKWAMEDGKDKYIPGDCGFDPLKFFPEEKAAQFEMQTKEIKHGRIAMMAVLGFSIQEALYGAPVTAETPFFFQPLFT